MKISKEVKVGFVSIVAIAILVWGYNYLKGTNLFNANKTVYTEYPFIGGLAKSSPVIVNGFKIGLVSDVYFKDDQSGNLMVELVITDKELKIPSNSVANLISLDLLSSKGIGLTLGDSDVELVDGDTIPSHFEKSMLDDVSEQLLPMKQKAEKLMISLDSTIVVSKTTLENLNKLFDEQNQRNLKLSLINLKTTLEKFETFADNANATMNTLKPTVKKYGDLADTLKQVDIKTTLDKANKTFEEITAVMQKMNNGEGTMGQLMTNDTLYQNLENATRDLDKLLIDMQANPKRYVHFSIFGRKDKRD
ncbi:MAG: MCE family protein [Flavobacteriales bacterium]|nr:MCE family protein [Flavobacteriales bacterium]MBL1233896.1 MCE family protein [Flavobacteriales bacterium]